MINGEELDPTWNMEPNFLSPPPWTRIVVLCAHSCLIELLLCLWQRLEFRVQKERSLGVWSFEMNINKMPILPILFSSLQTKYIHCHPRIRSIEFKFLSKNFSSLWNIEIPSWLWDYSDSAVGWYLWMEMGYPVELNWRYSMQWKGYLIINSF